MHMHICRHGMPPYSHRLPQVVRAGGCCCSLTAATSAAASGCRLRPAAQRPRWGRRSAAADRRLCFSRSRCCPLAPASDLQPSTQQASTGTGEDSIFSAQQCLPSNSKHSTSMPTAPAAACPLSCLANCRCSSKHCTPMPTAPAAAWPADCLATNCRCCSHLQGC